MNFSLCLDEFFGSPFSVSRHAPIQPRLHSAQVKLGSGVVEVRLEHERARAERPQPEADAPDARLRERRVRVEDERLHRRGERA